MTAEERQLVKRLLEENKNSVHPGRGKKNAYTVRLVCEKFHFDEDDYLPSYVVRDKAAWGLARSK